MASFQRSKFVLDNSGQNIEETYSFDVGSLGAGTYGSVRRGTHKGTSAVRAIKIIPKKTLKLLAKFHQEIQIMKEIEHPNIVRLYETFEDTDNIYLVMELCSGGELFDRILSVGFFSETETAHFVKQMLSAIYYLHTHGICHRDIKPENFLIEGSTLKLIDFGLSARFDSNTLMTTKSGTPYYVAPEILAGPYNEKCDIWSIGVLTYVLLCGYPPFNGQTDKDILVKVKRGKYEYPESEWGQISESGKKFVSGLLAFVPAERWSAQTALEHPWLYTEQARAMDPELQSKILVSLRAFQSVSRLKRVALTAIAHQLADGELVDLKQAFLTVDRNGDGQLTIAEIRLALESAKILIPPDFDDLIKTIDSDGSGSIDYMEFIAATLERQTYTQQDVCMRAFRMFDRNGDGKISAQEFKEIMKDDSVAAMMGEFDQNGDGEIDFGEFMAMIKKT